MNSLQPASLEEALAALRDCQASHRLIEIAGNRSKARMGGPIAADALRLETKKLNRVLSYDPRDLTISVEAGLPYAELTRILAEKGQFLPIEPPYSASATVGGMIAANTSGHRRRLFGSIRDLVIGMKFLTLDGKLVQSGGMVVKNVAGLDMSKLMIGSFGTLALIGVVNFKLMPRPVSARTFLFQSAKPAEVFSQRDRLLRSVLQPCAIDILNPLASARVGLAELWSLVVEAVGSEAVLDRYTRELHGFEPTADTVWPRIREFTPDYLAEHPAATVLRLSTTLMGLESRMTSLPSHLPQVARAGNGILYVYSSQVLDVPEGAKGVIESSADPKPPAEKLWPQAGNDFFLMQRIKTMFDPLFILNPGRLYGRI